MKRQITNEDLDRMFGPGPTIDKSQLLAMLDADTHVDSAVLRRLLDGQRFSLTNDEVVAAQTAFRLLRQHAADAILAMTTAQAHLRQLTFAGKNGVQRFVK